MGPSSRSVGQCGHGVEATFETDDARTDVAALAGEHRHADAPTAVERSEQIGGGQPDVGEEDFIELRLTRHLLQRAHLDAGRVHRTQEERDALVLGRLGIGTGHQDAPVAVAPSAAPHLLPVDDEGVAVGDGARGQTAEVAPGARFAEQLAPHVRRIERGLEVRRLLLGGAELQDRATGQHESHHVQCRRHTGDRTFE